MLISPRTLVNEALEKRQASALEMIRLLLNMENKAPSTVHDPYLADCREKLLNAYRKARKPPVLESIDDSTDTDNDEADPYDQTLFYMANARAYFQGLHLLPSTSAFQQTA